MKVSIGLRGVRGLGGGLLGRRGLLADRPLIDDSAVDGDAVSCLLGRQFAIPLDPGCLRVARIAEEPDRAVVAFTIGYSVIVAVPVPIEPRAAGMLNVAMKG